MVLRLIFIPFLLLLLIQSYFGCTAIHHVTSNAYEQGVGSLKNPWTLKKALQQKKKVKPGDTILLHNGIYNGFYVCNLKGEKEQPITIMSAPEEWAIIDLPDKPVANNANSLLTVNGDFLIFRDFEIRNSSSSRNSKVKGSSPIDNSSIDGLSIYGKDNKFINLVIHDNVGNNIGFWKTAERSEIYGCILYYAGWDGPDRGHGYNIYTQNGSPLFKPHEYHVGQFVKYKGRFYKAIKHHGDEIRPWSKGKKYRKSAKVYFKSALYISLTDLKKNGIEPEGSDLWKRVSPETLDSHLPTNSEYWEYLGEKDPAGFKTIDNNFIFSSHRMGISCYTETGVLNNYIFRDNIIFENGQLSKSGRQWNLLIGGINPAMNIFLQGNTFYFNKGGRPVQLGYKNDNSEAFIIGNYFINQSLFLRKWDTITLNNNLFYNKEVLRIRVNNKFAPVNYRLNNNIYITWGDKPFELEGDVLFAGNLDSLQEIYKVENRSIQKKSKNGENHIKLVPNKYDSKKVYITIHNLESLNYVNLYLKDFLPKGRKYKLIDVQNYFGKPVLEGVFDGKAIKVPMTLTEVAKPLGNVSVQPVHTGKELGTFILLME